MRIIQDEDESFDLEKFLLVAVPFMTLTISFFFFRTLWSKTKTTYSTGEYCVQKPSSGETAHRHTE